MSLTFEQMPGAIAELIGQVKYLTELLKHSQQTIQPPADTVMTLEEAAKYLGLTKTALRQNQVPRHKRLNKLFFIKSEVDEWIKEGRNNMKKEKVFLGGKALTYIEPS